MLQVIFCSKSFSLTAGQIRDKLVFVFRRGQSRKAKVTAEDFFASPDTDGQAKVLVVAYVYGQGAPTGVGPNPMRQRCGAESLCKVS